MRFEKLEVWKRACRLSVALYRALDGVSNWSFRDQVTRAGLSIPSNIAEGSERDSKKESSRFFRIAKGSCGELVTQVYIGMEAGFVDAQQGREWVAEVKEISAILGALIRRNNNP